jgi:lysophospholipase L1-like esterase
MSGPSVAQAGPTRRPRNHLRAFGPIVIALLIGAVVVTGARPGPAAAVDLGPTPKPIQPGCVAAGEPNALCIIVLGDSIAAGVTVDIEQRWWHHLRRHLEADLPDHVIAIDNWAISGSQVPVLESAARDQPAIGTYDLAIVIEGVNDEHVMSADAWRPRYEAAVAMLEAKGLAVIVAAPPPSFENGAFSPRFDGVAAAVRDVASRGRPLLDLAARWHADGPELARTYYSDRIHQSREGQVVMASMARGLVLESIGADAVGRPLEVPARRR